MSNIRRVSKAKLNKMIATKNLWSDINAGRLVAVEQCAEPAKSSPGGTSFIISYYDKDSNYVCTIHKILDKRGRVIHQHVKDVTIDGVRFKPRK